MRNPATLKKISDHLNISISTVSRALKDHQDVSQETKRRVKELAEMLDYEPNSFAVNLRKKHSDLFAIIVPEIASYFYHSFIQAVEEEARLLGYSIMILQSQNDPELESNNLKLCRYNHVAGVFIAINSNMENYSAFRKMEEWEIPMIFFDKVPSQGVFNKVCLADEQAGWLAAEKLAETGRKKIFAVMGSSNMSITRWREKGLRDFLQAKAPNILLEVAYCENEAQVTGILEKYYNINQPETAIFSMSDEILCGTIQFLNSRNMKYPSDVSLLTISNGFLPRLFNPAISYVETNGSQLGKLSFSRMKEIMEGRKSVKENFLDCHYYPGGSL
jgi:LacI family transcriptional regulator